MARIKIQRLESELLKIISSALLFKVRDREIKSVNLTAVKLSNDLSYAKIYYTTLDSNVEKVQRSLERSKGFFKKEIATADFMRVVPELVFKFDEQEEKARKLEKILAQIQQEKAESDEI
jgi:ribosome-binding factor A